MVKGSLSMKFRIGQGFDAHKLVLSRPLILGGITIPFELGLEGHSDADVLTHAIIDSLIGALSLGNIGTWFPDNNIKYKNANSMELLKIVISHKSFKEWQIVNIDSTIIIEKPKLSPFIPDIQKCVANILNTEISNISIKPKTTEKMGFCGRGEGIAVFVNTLLVSS
jgi:2-C-methyl-D-erythritol 2,4-cyclodiphosphate synthase